MNQDFSKSEAKIRKQILQAALFAGLGVFWLAAGLTSGVGYVVRHNLHSNGGVYDGFPPELLLACAYYVLSSYFVGLAVYRFGKAILSIGK